MTEKRYSKMMNHYGTSRTYCTGIYDNQNNRELQNSNQVITELNALHEENVELKNSLKEFEVFESNRIKGAVVTNDDFSVTLHSNNEAYMVCNMLNRFIRSVKNGSQD